MCRFLCGQNLSFLVELFQILKDDALKVLHSICQQIWKTQQCHRIGKGQFSFQSQRKAMATFPMEEGPGLELRQENRGLKEFWSWGRDTRPE